MGIIAEIDFDQERCGRCGCLLSENIESKRKRRILHEYDGTICVATMADITCGGCGQVNTFFYMADLLFPEGEKERPFAAVPTI